MTNPSLFQKSRRFILQRARPIDLARWRFHFELALVDSLPNCRNLRPDEEVFMKYVALLRGINVGKSVQVPMAALKTLLAGMGMTGVTSYLNSGNVIFESDQDRPALQDLLEGEMLKVFGQRIPTLVKTAPEIISIAQSIPADWGSNPTEQTYVAYLFKLKLLAGQLALVRLSRCLAHCPGVVEIGDHH